MSSCKILPHLALSALRKPQAWIRNFNSFEPVAITELPSSLFACPIRPDLIHRVTIWYRAGIRAGTACTKERGDVRGSIRKLYPQKGTGRARVGASRTNKRIGGGVCFGPKPKDWAFHLPKKILFLAFRSALSAKYLQNQLLVVKDESLLSVESLIDVLSMSFHYSNKKIMILDSQPAPRKLEREIASLQKVVYMSPDDHVNAYHLLDNKLLIITERAIHYYANKYNDSNLIYKLPN